MITLNMSIPTLRIKPLTFIGAASLIAAISFSLGRITSVSNLQNLEKSPVTLVTSTPAPTANPFVDTTYVGTLQKGNNGNLYLITTNAEALLVNLPTNIKVTQFVGKKIVARGKFDNRNKVFYVDDASSIEIIIQSQPVPTQSETPLPVSTLEPTM